MKAPRQTASPVDEQAPLLDSDLDHAIAPPDSKQRIQLHTQTLAAVLVCLLYFSVYVALAPEISIREDIVCKAYYRDHYTPLDSDCTVNDVQRELNLISQVYTTITQLPGFLLALPYGVLSDRIGRRRVLMLSVTGIALCEATKLFFTWQSNLFPLRAIWIAPLFRIIGGGDAVAATMVIAAIADVHTAQDRTTVFARVASVATVCELLAPLAGSVLMLHNAWIPVLLAYALVLVSAIVTFCLFPETQQQQAQGVTHTSLKPQAGKDSILEMFQVFKRYMSSLFAVKNVIFLLFGFFAAEIGSLAAGFELQYVHKRYGWSYAYAGSILSIRPLTTLLVLLVIIPTSTKILSSNFNIRNAQRDVLLARISAAFLTLGTLLLSISSVSWLAIVSFVIFALGNTFPTLGKSLLTTLGPPEMAGTLLSAINTSAALGAVVAGPLIATTFDFGLRQGGFWIGAPLFCVTALYAMTLGSVCIIGVSSGKIVDEAAIEEDDEN